MLSIICGVRFDENNDDFSKTKTYSNLLDNDHVQNIGEHDFFKTFMSHTILLACQETSDDDKEKTFESIKSYVKEYIKSCNSNDLISLAISCLQSFVIVNWLGPTPVELANIPSLLKNERPDEPTLNDKVFNLKEHFQNDDKQVIKILAIVNSCQ